MGEQLFVEQTADDHLVRLSHSAPLHTLQLGGMQPQVVAIDALVGVNKMIETPMITNIFSHIVRMDVLIVLRTPDSFSR